MYMDPVCRAPRAYARRVAAARRRGLPLQKVNRCRLSSRSEPRRSSRSRSLVRRRRRSSRHRCESSTGHTRRSSGHRRRSSGHRCERGPSAGSRRESEITRCSSGHRCERRPSADSQRSGSQWTRPRGRTVSPSPRSPCSSRRPRHGLIAAVVAVRNPLPLEKLPLMLEREAPKGKQYALAFDGEMYDQDGFVEYYGCQYGNYIWKSCAERTNAAISFVQAWLYFIRATGKDDTMHALLRFLRLEEWAEDFRWKSVLLIFIFRALTLRMTFLDQHPHIPYDADLDNEHDRKALNDIALSWTARYLTTSAASRGTARSVLRVFWNDWFGHKDFALLIATKHVLDWQMTLTLLSKHLQKLRLL